MLCDGNAGDQSASDATVTRGRRRPRRAQRGPWDGVSDHRPVVATWALAGR